MTTRNSSKSDVERELQQILKENQKLKTFQTQMFKCIPDTALSEQISMKLAIYIIDNINTQPSKCKIVLQYIIGLLEYNLINYDAIDTFYYNYYKILYVSRFLAPIMCQLIYMLTKDPNDLSRLLVLRIKRAFNLGIPVKPLHCLLMLIKSLRPDLVPERISAYSLEHAFRLLPIRFRNRLEETKHLHTIDDNISKSIDIQWRLANNKKDLTKVIPDISLVNIGSLYEKDSATKTIIEYNDLIELQSETCSSKNIANASSLLNNFAGIHFITYGDDIIKTRVIYYLQQSLRYEIQQFTPTSINNRQELFKKISNLYDCAQQGIPEISNLILEYFNEYKNFQIDHTLLNLLSWTVIRSYDDLHARLLLPLRDVYITRYSSIERCDIIDCISNLIVNFVTTCMYPSLMELKQPFQLSDDIQQEDPTIILTKISQWINKFSLEVIKLGGDGVLSCILNLYHTLYHLQCRLEPTVWICVAPPCLVYACLAGESFHYINSSCKLLLRYVDCCRNISDATREIEITKRYLTTFFSILNGTSMEISLDISQNLCDDNNWKFLRKNKLSYGITRNLFLMPYMVNLLRKHERITFDMMLNICAMYYPSVYQILKMFL